HPQCGALPGCATLRFAKLAIIEQDDLSVSLVGEILLLFNCTAGFGRAFSLTYQQPLPLTVTCRSTKPSTWRSTTSAQLSQRLFDILDKLLDELGTQGGHRATFCHPL